MKVNALAFEERPFSRIDSILTNQGFSKIGFGKSIRYRVALRDSSTESTYWLEIPVNQNSNEPNQAKLGEPSLYGEKRIPQPVREAVESKLFEIADYLRNIVGNGTKPLSNQNHYNSSMVRNEKEMEKLGKEMESLQTNKELSENGEIPDPIQYEKKDLEP
ncbi:hypothetical protein [Neobacillus soli]|uniref:hypothetical protein n=1 Tax=Neobacillus soli TaxID=220688 RepID=UPI000825B284|nr:hypothetical protein [Neobacillus soli]